MITNRENGVIPTPRKEDEPHIGKKAMTFLDKVGILESLKLSREEIKIVLGNDGDDSDSTGAFDDGSSRAAGQ